jgi:Uncharacterized membrane protein
MDEKTVVYRLVVAFILGAIIGIERDFTHKSAGIKTHVMVSLGSALTMVFGTYMAEHNSIIDPTRIPAQVVSGIGFLGALCVLKDQNAIFGLTTASSIWVMACIGVAVGGGFIIGAVTTTILILINLIFVPKIKRLIKRSSLYRKHHEPDED